MTPDLANFTIWASKARVADKRCQRAAVRRWPRIKRVLTMDVAARVTEAWAEAAAGAPGALDALIPGLRASLFGEYEERGDCSYRVQMGLPGVV